MKTKIILLAVFTHLFFISYSTNNLRINNPQCSWCNISQAEIKSAELEITPKGGFVENNLYLTIGLSNPFTNASLQLEIILDFGLPANSLVTDSWLWINGVPKQSEILDRWTASNIYEQIVNRRKDPSLLVKNGANQYSINIYPLKPNETRKVKITYLTPINLSGNTINCEYPSGILGTSAIPVSKLSVYAHPNGTFASPAIENGSTTFAPFQSADYGECFRAQIPNTDFGKAKIIFTDTNTSQVKFYRYGSNTEGIYQLSFVPSECFDQEVSSQKTCYLIDYDKSYYKGTKTQLTSILSSYLTGTYTEKDSFNIIFSNLALKQAFENWKPVSASNLTAAFNGTELSDYSNLIQLLAKGINFINNSGGTGKIVLLSNYSNFQGIEKSNDILKDINGLNVKNIPIEIIDYTDDYYFYNWTGSTYFYNNSYLFSNIARTNKGEFINLYDKISSSSFSELLTTSLEDISSEVINNVDVYTDMTDGFCFGRMNLSSGNFSNYKMNKAIHQVGKYKGNLPMTLEITGELNSRLIHSEYVLNTQNITETDSTLSTIWSGLDIKQLESETQNSQVINEIIFQSVENRVLSNYTAFLCLEDTIPVCENCNETDGGEIVTAINTKNLNKEVKAYPNPFKNHIQINIETSANFQKLEIYNMMGQLVKVFDPEKEITEFNWDGNAENGKEVKAGIYLVVARYKNKISTMKIQKI